MSTNVKIKSYLGIFSLKKFQDKAGGLNEICYSRGLCEVRSRLAKTPIYQWIPSFMYL